MKVQKSNKLSIVHEFEIDLEDDKFETTLKVEVRVVDSKITNFFYVNSFRFGRMSEKQENQVKNLIKKELGL
jgi:c-di-GMP-binding flagellar brake protein YcgR